MTEDNACNSSETSQAEEIVKDKMAAAINGGMKYISAAAKIAIVLVCIWFAVIMVVSPMIGAYNAMVDADVQCGRAAANVKVDLERRADLLPNLAAGVKGSAIFEHNTMVETIMARGLAQVGDIREHIDKTNPNDPASISSLQGDNSVLTALLGNFIKLQEQYPTLQTTQQFREFEAQVTATENEILVDRQTYNAAVMQYQATVRMFPNVLFAKYFGFSEDRWQSWESPNPERTKVAPTITFDDLMKI